MKTVTIIAFLTAPVGREYELAAQFDRLIPATRAEEGCIKFIVHQHPKMTDRFAVYEKFCDQAAFDAHLQYLHTIKFVEWIKTSGTELHFEQWNEKSLSEKMLLQVT